MIFDEIPTELKEHIFSYVTPNEWINTSKVSKEWLELTLGSIKKVESCHLLILDHLAEFINQQRDTNYTWVSLLTLMPRLEHLECCEKTEAFWQEISTVGHQLKILDFKPINDASFDWNKLDISFCNLTELRWDGRYQGGVFPLNFLASSPKLEKITLKDVTINADWKHKVPKSVKHIFLHDVQFPDEHQCSIRNLCENTSALETLSIIRCWLLTGVNSEFFDETPRLKKLELEFIFGVTTSTIIENALRKCRSLETVTAHEVTINDSWQRLIPENVKSINLFKIYVQENIRREFSLDWLFQNSRCLQSLQVTFVKWTGFDYRKLCSTENLKKLSVDKYTLYSDDSPFFRPGRDKPIDPFSNICIHMIRGSHLVDVEIRKVTIGKSWRHIFPSTIKRLKLKEFHLTKEAQLLFTPQFICENPSNIQSLIFAALRELRGDLPAMDLNAFTGMQMLQELILDLHLSGHGLQSILTHCSGLTDLLLGGLTAGALTNIPHNLVLPSLRKLNVKAPVDHPSLLLQHFPNVHTVDIAIVPPESSFSAIMNALHVADTVELKMHLSYDHLRNLVESIDDAKYKYFCLSFVEISWKVFSFYWTNSLLNASRKLNDIIVSKNNDVLRIANACSKLLDVFLSSDYVLWINNYPSSPLVRNVSTIPTSMDEFSQRYQEIMSKYFDDYDDDSDDEEIPSFMIQNQFQLLIDDNDYKINF